MDLRLLQDLFVALENRGSKILDAILESIGKPYTSTIGVLEGKTQNYSNLLLPNQFYHIFFRINFEGSRHLRVITKIRNRLLGNINALWREFNKNLQSSFYFGVKLRSYIFEQFSSTKNEIF